MDFSTILDAFNSFYENVWVKQVTVVVVYAVLAKIVDLFIDRILKRITKKTKFTIDDHLIDILHVPVSWTIFLIGVQHALLMRTMQVPWQNVLPALAKSFVLLIWLIAALRLFNKVVEQNLAKILARGKIGNDLFLLLKNIIRVVVVIAGLLWLLSVWKVDLTPLFASAGIAGIAVALAAKDTLANFFGGISIFADNTFKVGDYIIIESGERGEVSEIGIRSTRIKTRDDVIITIPNSILANSKIINESAPVPRFRIRVPVGVSYGSDLEKVENLLLSVTENNNNISAEPEPRVRLRRFGDSSVDFELLCWVEEPSLKGFEIHNLLNAIYNKFELAGITIPFPQRDIHIIDSSASDIFQKS